MISAIETFLKDISKKAKLYYGQHQNKTVLNKEGNHQQNDKVTYWIGEEIYKWCILERVVIQNKQLL